jgi:hypothetical protein
MPADAGGANEGGKVDGVLGDRSLRAGRSAIDCSFDAALARLVSRSGRLHRSRLGGAGVDHYQDKRSNVILNLNRS